MALPTMAIQVHSLVLGSRAPARRCPWSTDAGLKPTSNRGSQAPRGDGRRVTRDRHLRRVRPRLRRACASVNASLNDARSSRRRVEESPRHRESGARRFTRSMRAEQPDAMLWGALESCPEGNDWKRAPHALRAMRRMCRGAQTRYIKIRLRKCRVNFASSVRPSRQKAGHRAIAQVVPRGGVVNARRPGLGRVEAQRRALTMPSTARESNARWCRRAMGTAFVARIPEEVAAFRQEETRRPPAWAGCQGRNSQLAGHGGVSPLDRGSVDFPKGLLLNAGPATCEAVRNLYTDFGP
jgi:hypothetical protein